MNFTSAGKIANVAACPANSPIFKIHHFITKTSRALWISR